MSALRLFLIFATFHARVFIELLLYLKELNLHMDKNLHEKYSTITLLT